MHYLPSSLSCYNGALELPKGDLLPPLGFAEEGGTRLIIIRIALIPVWRAQEREEEKIQPGYDNPLIVTLNVG